MTPENLTKYVVIFVFDAHDHVLLISKNRPDWQAGRLNGVGGHMEGNETPAQAMSRELREETGIDIDPTNVVVYAILNSDKNLVYFGYAYSRTTTLHPQALTDEVPVLLPISSLDHHAVLNNLHWLIPMATHHQKGVHVIFEDDKSIVSSDG